MAPAPAPGPHPRRVPLLASAPALLHRSHVAAQSFKRCYADTGCLYTFLPQVNPLMALPRVDPRFGVPPQKVSFYSSEGVKMDFVATTVQ